MQSEPEFFFVRWVFKQMAELIYVATTRAGINALEAAKRLGHGVTLVTSPKDQVLLNDDDRARIERTTNAVVQCADTQDADAVQSALEAVLREHPVDGVVCTFEMFATSTAIAADRLGLRATNLQGVLNARDKARCREILDENGIPSVRYRVVVTAQEAVAALAEIGYPAIVKPKTAGAKAMTFIATNEAEVVARFEQHEAEHAALNDLLRSQVSPVFLIEEMARGPLCSIEVAVDAYGDWAPLAIARRQLAKGNPIVEMGSSLPSGFSDAQYDEIAAYTIRIAKALDLRLGIFHTEFIYTADGPRLVEVNPRIGGGPLPEVVLDATDVDLFEILARIHAGEHVGYTKLPFKRAAGHHFIGPLDDVVVREDLPADWLDQFRPRIVAADINVKAGQHIRGMRGNFDVRGLYSVVGDSYDDIIAKMESLRVDMERVLGFALTASDG